MAYKYEFPADELALQTVEKLTEVEWWNIFELILNNKSIDYDIDFPDLNPLARLKQVFNFVYTFQLDKQNLYQQVLVGKLVEDYEKSHNLEQNFILIQLIDYVRPLRQYPRLESLITNVSVKNDFIGPDGCNLHFHLINAVMVMDINHNLYSYLRNLSGQTALPEFYQISIRYIYMMLDQKAFDDFMLSNFDKICYPNISRTVLLTFDEYAFYKKSFILIFNWLVKSRTVLQARFEQELKYFIHELENYLINLYVENQHWLAFYPLLILVKSFNPGFKMISKYFTILEEESEILLPAKTELFYHLGQMDGIVISKAGICFSDNKTIDFNDDTNYIRGFMDGYKLKNKPIYQSIALSRLTINYNQDE